LNTQKQLETTVNALVKHGKGILAADESNGTIAKRFKAIDVESTEETRRSYRSMILATRDLGDFISGVILFEETLNQCTDDGTGIPLLLESQGIVPGVKVDKGKRPMAQSPGEEITEGLDKLAERLRAYRERGARFAKWRDVYTVSAATPGRLAIEANAEVLARYAAICQAEGMVPIVEPEVLIDGDHSIRRCAEVTEAVLFEVFHALHRHGVTLEHMLLKPSMVLPGTDHPHKATPEEVAAETVRIFRRVVPCAVPGIHFLSGGQAPEEATANLNAINCTSAQPWALSFSYGRALQQPALQAWRGDQGNAAAVQAALYHRARLNGAARRGSYTPAMERESA
jgi:fructose-bisphosphate aldolase class I